MREHFNTILYGIKAIKQLKGHDYYLLRRFAFFFEANLWSDLLSIGITYE